MLLDNFHLINPVDVQSLVVGLSGPAGVGKTSTARKLVPMARNRSITNSYPTEWDHYFYSLPLYELVSAKTKIEGMQRVSRQKYEIHRILFEILQGYIEYDELIKVVNNTFNTHIPSEGKPREFLQSLGDICRSYHADCFTDWITRKIKSNIGIIQREFLELESELDDDSPPSIPPYLINIVSDVRFTNEISKLKGLQNTLTIDMTARPEVLNQRILDRDGHLMTPNQWAHISETQSRTEEFQSYVDVSIDTSDMSQDEQTQAVKDIILNRIGMR